MPVMMKSIVAILLVALAACSEESVSSAAETLGRQINRSQRDRVVENAQKRIVDAEHCTHFKDEILVVGQRYESAVNASIHMELSKVRKAAEAVGCLRGREPMQLDESVRASSTESRFDTENVRRQHEARMEAAWSKYFQPSEECLQTVSVECGNAHIRARREFERKYAAGEI